VALDTTLRLLARTSGRSAADLAAAIPRVGAATVRAWMAGDKLPGREQLIALARALGSPPARCCPNWPPSWTRPAPAASRTCSAPIAA